MNSVIKIILLVCLFCLVVLSGIFTFHQNKSVISISAVVVPHHDLVAAKRDRFFFELASDVKKPPTIILVSPNHYSLGQGNIQTDDQDWSLDKGKITPNKKVISFLNQQNVATNEPASFTDEHGIYNILGDIHHYFPKTPIVPLILKQTSQEELSKLEQGLLQSCSDCLMIASVDFSHYQPAVLAQLHDDRSIRDLQTLDTNDVLTGAEVNSGPALALLTMWAKDHDTMHFTLTAHTNSGIIFQDPDLETTTHVFGWYESGKKIEPASAQGYGQAMPEKSVSFLFGGDMMFARGIEQKFGSDFNNAMAKFGDRVFWGTDASVVNLEGIISNQPQESGDLNFRFSPSIVKTLSFLHINGASLANNHSDNAGQEGLTTTRALLGKADIQPFGGPTGKDITKIAQFKGDGISLTVIGVNMTLIGQDAKALVPVIAEYKKDPTMRVIIMPHWGIEYFNHHTQDQEEAAHGWVDAGADMVIGSHPHVIEDAQLYKGIPIIYSLGNLLFDQNFSRATQEGLLIGGKFTNEGLIFFALPVRSIKYQPQLITGQRKKEILNSLYIPFKNYLENSPAGQVVKINR